MHAFKILFDQLHNYALAENAPDLGAGFARQFRLLALRPLLLLVCLFLPGCSYPIEIQVSGAQGRIRFEFDTCGELLHPLAKVTEIDVSALEAGVNGKERLLCSVRVAPSQSWVYGGAGAHCPSLAPGRYRVFASYPGHSGSRDFQVQSTGSVTLLGNGSCN